MIVTYELLVGAIRIGMLGGSSSGTVEDMVTFRFFGFVNKFSPGLIPDSWANTTGMATRTDSKMQKLTENKTSFFMNCTKYQLSRRIDQELNTKKKLSKPATNPPLRLILPRRDN